MENNLSAVMQKVSMLEMENFYFRFWLLLLLLLALVLLKMDICQKETVTDTAYVPVSAGKLSKICI